MAPKRQRTDFVEPTSLFVPQDWYPIVTSNSDPLPTPIRGIRATTAGNVKVTTAAGHDRVMAFLAGETRWIACTKVFTTGTTATGLEGAV